MEDNHFMFLSAAFPVHPPVSYILHKRIVLYAFFLMSSCTPSFISPSTFSQVGFDPFWLILYIFSSLQLCYIIRLGLTSKELSFQIDRLRC